MWNWIKDLFKPQPKKPTDSDVVTYPPWYRIALLELGQKEVSGSKSNPKIIEYHKQTSLKAKDDETPWCASFVNWCLEKSGIKGTNSARARSFVGFGAQVENAQLGDIVVLERGSDRSQGHVGFFTGDSTKTHYELLSGNSSNRVEFRKFKKSDVIYIGRIS